VSVLVVGSVALDTIKTPKGYKKEILGGSAVFSSVSASLFSPVKLVAVVGEDFPKKHINFLKNKKVDIKGLEICEGKTFRWEGEYSSDFNDPKTLATHLNVFADFNPKIPKSYKNSKHVFLANIDPDIQWKVLTQLPKREVVVCDTMNYWIESKTKQLLKVLKEVDIFLLNELEARLLTGENNLLTAAKKILKFGPKVVVIKKGSNGSLLVSDKFRICLPAFLLDSIIDPTGAGDTFAGGFIGYLSKSGKINKENLKKAICYGSIMATFAVEGFSLDKLGALDKAQMNKRFKEYKDQVTF